MKKHRIILCHLLMIVALLGINAQKTDTIPSPDNEKNKAGKQQPTITGFIFDASDKKPLAKVRVELKSTEKGISYPPEFTNPRGQFKFSIRDPSAVFTIHASLDGYEPYTSRRFWGDQLIKQRENIYLRKLTSPDPNSTSNNSSGTKGDDNTNLPSNDNEGETDPPTEPITLYGLVFDKNTNQGIDSVTINVRNNSNNEIIYTKYTNYKGEYIFEIKDTSGIFYVEALKNGYGLYNTHDSTIFILQAQNESIKLEPIYLQKIVDEPKKSKLLPYLIYGGGGILILGIGFYFLRMYLINNDPSSKKYLIAETDKPDIKKETIHKSNGGDVHSKNIDFESASPDEAGTSPDSKSDQQIGYQEGSAKSIIDNGDAPRFLQSAIKDTNEKYALDFLAPDQDYKVEVRIGYEDKNFFVTEEQFDTSAVFAHSTMEFEPIQIKFKSNLDDKVHFKEIQLPRQGNSESAFFNIHTKTQNGNFEGEFYAYHRGRLIQHAQLALPIQSEQPTASPQRVLMKTIFCTRKNLSDISTRSDFSTSIEFEEGTKGSSSLQGINKGEPVDLYFENGLKEHLSDMKMAIESALIDIKKHPADLLAQANQELLLYLAIKGNLIHTNFIRGAIAPDGPIQIITNYQDYVPLEFVYTLPPPLENATLCQHAIDALKEGICKGCFDHGEDPSPHVCPFGFWSFSRIVERHSYQKRKNESKADYILVSEPTSKRTPLPVLQNAIYGSSQRVETTETKGVREEIASAIKKNTLHFFEANDWNDWAKVSSENSIDSLVLVVHIEKDSKFNVNKIEIGKDFVLQNYFRSRVIVNQDMETPPFIIIIGCESTNLASSGFDVSSHLMNAGAAIVISNFTKIRGRQAKDIVIKLFDFLKENGHKEIILGEIMLKLRQYLLAEGLIAGLSLVVQGDADWNIKS